MRRAPIVLTATAAGVAGILTFHTKQATDVSVPASKPSTTSSPSTTAPQQTGPRSTTTTAPAAPGATKTVTGPVEQYGFGQLSVRVTEQGGRITGVSLASLSTAEPYSQGLAQQTAPQLGREVVAAQSPRIQGISGATYTSQAYALSAQGAIDSLGHP